MKHFFVDDIHTDKNITIAADEDGTEWKPTPKNETDCCVIMDYEYCPCIDCCIVNGHQQCPCLEGVTEDGNKA